MSRTQVVKAMLASAGAALALGVAHADDAGIFTSPSFTTTDGQQVYQQICQGCHMPDARGAVGAGRYPSLAASATLASRQYTALTVLAGRRNMPAFGVRHAIGFFNPPLVLSEEQIAAVVNYVRTHFGNHYTDPTSAAEVQALDRTLH